MNDNPEMQEFFRKHGIEVDEEGFPKGMSLPGPPENCTLCGTLAESPVPALVGNGAGQVAAILMCAECYRSSITDQDDFFRKVRSVLCVEELEEGRTMKITDVKISLMHRTNKKANGRLRAFAQVVLDDVFVIHDVKVIEGNDGLFCSMPDRRITDCCPHCNHKNHIFAHYCNWCGGKLDELRSRLYERWFQNICHSINNEFRIELEGKVLDAFDAEEARLAHLNGKATV